MSDTEALTEAAVMPETETEQLPIVFDHQLYAINGVAASQVFAYDESPYYFEYFQFIGDVLIKMELLSTTELTGTVTAVYTHEEEVVPEEPEEGTGDTEGGAEAEDTEPEYVIVIDGYTIELESGVSTTRVPDEVTFVETVAGAIGSTVKLIITQFLSLDDEPLEGIMELVQIASEAAQIPTMYELAGKQAISASAEMICAGGQTVSSSTLGTSTTSMMSKFKELRSEVITEAQDGTIDLQQTLGRALPEDVNGMLTTEVLQRAAASSGANFAASSTVAKGMDGLQDVLYAIALETKKRFFAWFVEMLKPHLDETLTTWAMIPELEHLYWAQAEDWLCVEFGRYAKSDADAVTLMSKLVQRGTLYVPFGWSTLEEDLKSLTKIGSEELYDEVITGAYIPGIFKPASMTYRTSGSKN
jgi:hypothetical protein